MPPTIGASRYSHSAVKVPDMIAGPNARSGAGATRTAVLLATSAPAAGGRYTVDPPPTRARCIDEGAATSALSVMLSVMCGADGFGLVFVLTRRGPPALFLAIYSALDRSP